MSCHGNIQVDRFLPILQSIKAHLHLIDGEMRIQWTNATGAARGSRIADGIEGKHCYDIYPYNVT